MNVVHILLHFFFAAVVVVVVIAAAVSLHVNSPVHFEINPSFAVSLKNGRINVGIYAHRRADDDNNQRWLDEDDSLP